MKNVTITLDETVARWARVEAAKAGKSLSRWVGDHLQAEMRKPVPAGASGPMMSLIATIAASVISSTGASPLDGSGAESLAVRPVPGAGQSPRQGSAGRARLHSAVPRAKQLDDTGGARP